MKNFLKNAALSEGAEEATLALTWLSIGIAAGIMIAGWLLKNGDAETSDTIKIALVFCMGAFLIRNFQTIAKHVALDARRHAGSIRSSCGVSILVLSAIMMLLAPSPLNLWTVALGMTLGTLLLGWNAINTLKQKKP